MTPLISFNTPRAALLTSHEGALSSKSTGTDPFAPESMLPTLFPSPEKGLKDAARVLVLALVDEGEGARVRRPDLVRWIDRSDGPFVFLVQPRNVSSVAVMKILILTLKLHSVLLCSTTVLCEATAGRVRSVCRLLTLYMAQ